jgi:thioredoxin 1
MRRLLMLWVGGIFLTMQACSSQPDKNTVNAETASVPESKQTMQGVNDPKSETGIIAISEPVHITKADFLEKIMDYQKNTTEWVYKGSLPCLIDFYADWCAPCRQTAPILDELAHEYSGKIIIYKVDVQKERELASVFGIQSIPAFLYCPLTGNPSMSAGIAGSREETKEMFIQQIESLLIDKALESTQL